MRTKKLPKAFDHYHHQVEVLWRFFRKHGNRVTQQHFDKAFKNARYKQYGSGKVRFMRRTARCLTHFRTICGPNFGYRGYLPETPWSVYLDILQNLMRYGITTVEGKKVDESLTYSFLRKPKINNLCHPTKI